MERVLHFTYFNFVLRAILRRHSLSGVRLFIGDNRLEYSLSGCSYSKEMLVVAKAEAARKLAAPYALQLAFHPDDDVFLLRTESSLR